MRVESWRAHPFRDSRVLWELDASRNKEQSDGCSLEFARVFTGVRAGVRTKFQARCRGKHWSATRARPVCAHIREREWRMGARACAHAHARARACARPTTKTHSFSRTHAGVSEACARQAKGRRGASNGFAALQNLEVGDDEDASGKDEEGPSGTAAGERQEAEEGAPGTEGDCEKKRKDEKRGIRAEHPVPGAENIVVHGLGWAGSESRVREDELAGPASAQ